MKKISFFYLIILFAFALNGFSQDITLSEIDNYNDWGKKALVVNNSIIELVIFPEIGGRVLYYGFPDDEYLAVNESEMDKTYDADTDGTGPWKSWGYGGYKVWPAPQSVWNWPPPPHLDWGNYNFTVEHESPDSVIIFLESEEENLRAPGLVFTRRFKAYKGSTKVTIEQTIINNNSSAQNWSVWDVTQAVVNHSDNNDYSNFSVYFPANKSEFITGPAYGDLDDEVTQINDEISMFKYNSSKTHAKLFCYLENGWECFTDERDKQSYIKHFPSLAGNHPDEGANFEIYSGGGYIEIEVLSPITNIAGNGGEYTYTQNWYATKTNGAVQNVNHAAVVNEYLSFNSETSNITGAYGIITSGSLKLRFLDSSGEELELSEAIPVYSSM
ncbi:MAG: hypothetical protein JXA77_04815, partial [Bacteroidales bacterium]|nr:hypothetical protein [Bacteroidales bacterium]